MYFIFSIPVDIKSELLLFNDSPQISGLNLTADFNLNGCAQITCAVDWGTPNTDCKSFVFLLLKIQMLRFQFSKMHFVTKNPLQMIKNMKSV